MAYEEVLQNVSLIAGQNLSSYQYHFVKVDTDGEVILCGDGELAAGILQNAPTSGLVAALAPAIISKLVVASGVTAGDLLKCGTTGHGETATTGEIVLAIALDSTPGGSAIIPALERVCIAP